MPDNKNKPPLDSNEVDVSTLINEYFKEAENNKDLLVPEEAFKSFKNDSKYLEGLTFYQDPNKFKASKQGILDEIGNQVVKTPLKVGLDIISTVGYLGDLENIGGILGKVDTDYNNWLSSLTKKASDKLDEELPLYKKDPNAIFNAGDSAWWVENISNVLGSAASFGIVGAGIAKGLSKATSALKYYDVLKAAKALDASSQLIGTAGLTYAEAIMNGSDTYLEVLKQKGLIDPENYDLNNLPKNEEAANAAAKASQLSMLAFGLNYHALSPVFRNANVNSSLISNTLKPLAGETAEQYAARTLNKNIVSTSNTFKTALEEAPKEALEEGLIVAAKDEGLREAGINKFQDESIVNRYFKSLLSPEGLVSMGLGAFGGVANTAIIQSLSNLQKDSEGKTFNDKKLDFYNKQRANIIKNLGDKGDNLLSGLETHLKYSKDLENAVTEKNDAKIELAKNNLFNSTTYTNLQQGTFDSYKDSIRKQTSASTDELLQNNLINDASEESEFKQNASKFLGKLNNIQKVYNEIEFKYSDYSSSIKRAVFLNTLENEALNSELDNINSKILNKESETFKELSALKAVNPNAIQEDTKAFKELNSLIETKNNILEFLNKNISESNIFNNKEILENAETVIKNNIIKEEKPLKNKTNTIKKEPLPNDILEPQIQDEEITLDDENTLKTKKQIKSILDEATNLKDLEKAQELAKTIGLNQNEAFLDYLNTVKNKLVKQKNTEIVDNDPFINYEDSSPITEDLFGEINNEEEITENTQEIVNEELDYIVEENKILDELDSIVSPVENDDSKIITKNSNSIDFNIEIEPTINLNPTDLKSTLNSINKENFKRNSILGSISSALTYVYQFNDNFFVRKTNSNELNSTYNKFLGSPNYFNNGSELIFKVDKSYNGKVYKYKQNESGFEKEVDSNNLPILTDEIPTDNYNIPIAIYEKNSFSLIGYLPTLSWLLENNNGKFFNIAEDVNLEEQINLLKVTRDFILNNQEVESKVIEKSNGVLYTDFEGKKNTVKNSIKNPNFGVVFNGIVKNGVNIVNLLKDTNYIKNNTLVINLVSPNNSIVSIPLDVRSISETDKNNISQLLSYLFNTKLNSEKHNLQKEQVLNYLKTILYTVDRKKFKEGLEGFSNLDLGKSVDGNYFINFSLNGKLYNSFKGNEDKFNQFLNGKLYNVSLDLMEKNKISELSINNKNDLIINEKVYTDWLAERTETDLLEYETGDEQFLYSSFLNSVVYFQQPIISKNRVENEETLNKQKDVSENKSTVKLKPKNKGLELNFNSLSINEIKNNSELKSLSVNDLNEESINNFLDKLFVKKSNDTYFNSNQQQDIIDSILYFIVPNLIKDFSKTNINKSFSDFFNALEEEVDNLKTLKDNSNDTASLKNLIDNNLEYKNYYNLDYLELENKINLFDEILNIKTFAQFKVKTLEQLKTYGFDVSINPNYSIEQIQELNDFEIEIIDDAILENIFGLESERKDPRQSVTWEIKLLASIQEDTFFENGIIYTKFNELGLPKLLSFDTVYNNILTEITNSNLSDYNYKAISETLLKSKNSNVVSFINKLNSFEDNTLKNKFVKAVSLQQNNSLVTLFNLKNSSYVTTRIFNSDLNSKAKLIKNTWFENHKEKLGVEGLDENLNYVLYLDKNKLKNLNDYWNTSSKTIQDAINVFNGLGIELSEKAFESLEPVNFNSILLKNNKNKINGLKGFVENIFKSLENKKDIDLNVSSIINDDLINILANIESTYSSKESGITYSNSEGKIEYNFSLPTFLNTILNKIKNNISNNEFIKTDFTKNSNWLKVQPELGIIDGLVNESNDTGSKRNRLTLEEQHLLIINNFQKEGNLKNFIAPTLSDKSKSPFFSLPKINLKEIGLISFDSNNNIILSNQLLESFYTQIKDEIDRYVNFNVVYKNLVAENDTKQLSLIPEKYKEGANNLFLIPELNKLKERFLVEDESDYKKEVLNLINNFLINETKNLVNVWNKNKIAYIDANNNLNSYFNEYYLNNELNSFKNNKTKINYAALDLVLNYTNFYINFYKIVGGDLAFASKSNNINKTLIEYTKRLASVIAPGTKGNHVNKTSTVIYANDYTPKAQEYLQKIYGKDAKIDVTDAQEYTTVKEHINKLYAYGQINEAIYKSTIDKINNAKNNYYEFSKEELESIKAFQPMKPVYRGTENQTISDTLGNSHSFISPVYIKSSSFPLLPQFTIGLELDNLRIAMENSNVDRLAFSSAVKLGAKKLVNLLRNDFILTKNELENIFNSNKNILDNNYFSIQQETPFDRDKNKILTISQMNKLLFEGISDINFNLNDKEYTGKELKKLKEQIRTQMFKNSAKKLAEELDLVITNNGAVKFNSLDKIIDKIKSEALARNYSVNDIESLKLVNGELQIPLYLNNSSNRFEGILQSLVTDVVLQEVEGKSFVQGSSLGFKNLKEFNELSEEIKSKIIFTDSWEGELKYINKEKNIKYAQILLPNQFRDNRGNIININKFTKKIIDNKTNREKVILDFEKLPQSLVQTIGARIPNQGHNSMLPIEIVGFLPSEVGDLVIVPKEITKQMGSDFDVDKLYMYFNVYNFNENLNKFEVETYSNNLSNLSNRQLNQYYLDIHKSILTNDYVLDRVIQPLDNPILDNIIKEVTSTNSNQVNSPLSLTNQLNEYDSQKSALQLVGIGAVGLTFNSIIQYNENLNLTNELNVLGLDLSKIGGKDKIAHKTHENINILLNAFLDNAKDKKAGYLNLNNITYPVVQTFLMLKDSEGNSLNLDDVLYFINQPIIIDYVKELNVLNSSLNNEFVKDKNTIIGTKLLGNFYKSLSDSNQPSYLFSNTDLKNNLNQAYNNDSLKEFNAIILNLFEKIQLVANDVTFITSTLNIDSKGVGKDLITSINTQQKIDYLDKLDNIKNVESILADSEIGATVKYGVQLANNIWKNLFIYNSKLVQDINNNVLKSLNLNILTDKLNRDIILNLKQFLFSSNAINLFDNVNQERNKLLTGENSLAKRLKSLSSSEWYKNNLFLNNLQFSIKEGKLDKIKFVNSLSNRLDEQKIIRDFSNLLISDNFEQRELGLDLIKYSFVTGGTQNPSNFVRYIPTPFIETLELNKNFGLEFFNASDNKLLVKQFTKQFIQHNPKYAVKITHRDNITSNNKELVINKKDFSYYIKNNNLPTFLSTYDKNINSWVLFELDSLNNSQAIYLKINTLGSQKDKISEYNINDLNNQQVSLIERNNINSTEINYIEETVDLNKQSLNKVDTNLSKSLLLAKELGFSSKKTTNENIKDVLVNIKNNSKNESYKVLAEFFTNLPLDKFINNLTFNKKDGRGTFINGEIDINFNNIEKTANSIYKRNVESIDIEQIFLEEITHALTVSDLNSKNENIISLKGVYNKLKEKYPEFESFNKKYINNKQEEQIEYPLSSFAEFIAATITNTGFQEFLANEEFKTNLSILDRIKELFNKFLNSLANQFNFKTNSNLLTFSVNNIFDYLENIKNSESTYSNLEINTQFKNASIKDGVKQLFENNPELANIGTPEQYSQYLDTIFPDSKVKDIVYNASNYNSQIPDNTVYKVGLFLSNQIEYVKNFAKQNNKKFINALIINSKNIKYTDKEGIQSIGRNKEIGSILDYNDLDYIDYLVEEEKLSRDEAFKIVTKETFDTLQYNETEFSTKDKYGFVGNEYVVFEPEQIHILGSKQDIEGFKNWINSNLNIKSLLNKELQLSSLSVNNYAIPLKNNEDLYKQYNLLTNDGKIKQVNPLLDSTKKWLKTLNQSPYYNFKLRNTTGGWKILIFPYQSNLEFKSVNTNKLSKEFENLINQLNDNIVSVKQNILKTNDSDKKTKLNLLLNKLENQKESIINNASYSYIKEVATQQAKDIKAILFNPQITYNDLQLVKDLLDTWNNLEDTLNIDKKTFIDILESFYTPTDNYRDLNELWLETTKNIVWDYFKNKTKFSINKEEESKYKKIIIEELKDIGSFEQYMLGLDKTNNRLLQILDNDFREKTNRINSKLNTLIKQGQELFKEIQNSSLFKQNGWDLFYQTDSMGNKSGGLINKYSQDWFNNFQAKNIYRTDKLEEIRNNNNLTKTQKSELITNVNKEYFKWLDENTIQLDIRYLIDVPNHYKNEQEKEAYKNKLIKQFGEPETEYFINKQKELYQEFLNKEQEYYNEISEQLKDNLITEQEAKDLTEKFDYENNPIIYFLDKETNFSLTKANPSYKITGYKYIIQRPIKFDTKGNKTNWYDSKFETLEKLKDENGNPINEYKFYLWFQNTLEEMVSYLPENITKDFQSNFIPEIQKQVLNNFLKDGIFTTMNNLSEEFISSLTSNNSDSIKDNKIPLYFTNPFVQKQYKQLRNDYLKGIINDNEYNLKLKNLTDTLNDKLDNNLFNVLLGFSTMALNYKFKSEIEDEAKIFTSIIDNASEFKGFDVKGEVVLDKSGMALKNTKELLKYNIESRLYNKSKSLEGNTGIKLYTMKDFIPGLSSNEKIRAEELIKEKESLINQLESNTLEEKDIYKLKKRLKEIDFEFKNIVGGTLYLSKVADNLIKFTQLKTFGFNPISPIVNGFVGFLGNLRESASGKYFTDNDLIKANKLILFGNKTDKKKIAAILDRFNIIDQVGEVIIDKNKLNPTWVSKYLNPYQMMRSSDEIIKAQSTISALLFRKIGNTDLSLYDAFNEDGSWNTELAGEVDESYIYNLQSYLQAINETIHGNYNTDSPMLVNKSAIGRLVGQFKFRWMSTGIAERFQGERFNERTGTITKGSYRSMFGSESIGTLNVLRYLSGLMSKSEIETVFKDREIDLINMKKNLRELQIMLFLFSIGSLAKIMLDDEDDEDSLYKKLASLLINTNNRVLTDLTFYASPSSFKDLTKDAVASVRTITDFQKAIVGINKLLIDDEFTIEDEILRISKAFPYTNNINKLKYQSDKIIN